MTLHSNSHDTPLHMRQCSRIPSRKTCWQSNFVSCSSPNSLASLWPMSSIISDVEWLQTPVVSKVNAWRGINLSGGGIYVSFSHRQPWWQILTWPLRQWLLWVRKGRHKWHPRPCSGQSSWKDGNPIWPLTITSVSFLEFEGGWNPSTDQCLLDDISSALGMSWDPTIIEMIDWQWCSRRSTCPPQKQQCGMLIGTHSQGSSS